MTGDKSKSADSPWRSSPFTCHPSLPLPYRRVGAPGPFFLIFGLREPRGSVCLALGGRFLRAARFSLLRSARSLMCRVCMGESFVLVGLRLLKRGVSFDELDRSMARKADGQFGVVAFALAFQDRSQAVSGMADLRPELPPPANRGPSE